MAGSCAGEATALGGASGWYAPSMNIHRAPFIGRNGEYYSEDGFLSGVIGSLEVRGAASKGLYATIKQAVMSAFNRIGATWTGGNYALLTSVLHNEWGFRGWIVTDSASSAGSYMDASQMIEASGVSKLAQAENLAKWTFDQNDPAEYHCAREVMRALLCTAANSHVMNGAMHGSVWVDGPQKLEVVRWVATGVSVVGLGLIDFTVWRNHVRRRAERAEQE